MVSDLVKKMRREGRAYLARKPRAFGRGGSSSRGRSTITPGAGGTYSVVDPKTGKTIITSSKSFAESIAGAGYESALETSKAEGGGRSGRSRTRFLKEQAKRNTSQIKKIAELEKKGITEEKRITINRAGDRLEVSQWRDEFGRTSERIRNLTKGGVVYSSFDKPKGGVLVKPVGVPTTKYPMIAEASGVKITKSSDPNRLIVTFPNGQRGTIKSTGRVVVGARLAGKKYIFMDGKIISIGGIDTTGRVEYVIPDPTVQAITQPTGLIAKNIKKLNDLRKVKETSSIRNKQRKVKNELTLLGVTVATTVISGAIAIIALPSTLWKLAKNPSQLKAIPSAIKTGAVSFGQTMRISPTAALGMIAGELFLLKGIGMTTKIVGKVATPIATRLNPYFRKVDEGKIHITTTKGKTTLEVGVIGKGVPLRKQAQLSGKKLDVAATVQADKLINLFGKGRQKIVRKPIPGEEALTLKTKYLLKKFDADKINRKEFFELNKRLIKETGDKTLLERSIFLDPKGTVRFTRLAGEQPSAGIIDILRGDFTFKTPQPQILVFSDVSVARFPVSLRDVARKLKAGKTLTEVERIRLVEWQLKKSGKLKPIGDIRYKGGKELEVTIAPGELIKRVKKLGVTLINGKKVEIIEARIFKPNPILKSKILKADKGLLNKKQLMALEKELERITGFKSSRVRRTTVSRKRARVPFRGLRIGSKAARGRLDRIRKVTKRPTIRPLKRPPRKVTKRPPRKVTKRPVKIAPARPPKRARPHARPPARPPIIPSFLLKKFKKKKLKKKVDVYYIKVKQKGKLVNLNPRPLPIKDAKDMLAWSIDKNLVRTAFFYPMGKSNNVIKVPPKMANYFAKNKRKFRPYKIRVGKKRQLLNGYIEKRKFIQDSSREKLQLQLARLRAIAKRKTSKSKTKTNRKPTKRVIARKKVTTLNNLKSIKKSLLLKRKRMVNKLKKR